MNYLQQFKKELEFSNLAGGTEYRYLKTVERYLDFTQGKPAFTREEVIDFIASLGDTTPTYKNWCMRVLKRFYEACAPRNKPWPMRKREGPRVEIRPQPYLKPEEVGALLEAAKGNKLDYAILQLFTDTIMRRDELCNLDRDNYNGSELLIKLSKGEDYRTVALTPEARRALDSYLRTRGDGNQALFVNNNGKRISPASISSMIKEYLQRLGIYKPGLGSHGFRRGGVTDLAKKGIGELAIARWGGWKSTAMVNRYSQLAPSDVEDEIRAVKPLRKS